MKKDKEQDFLEKLRNQQMQRELKESLKLYEELYKSGKSLIWNSYWLEVTPYIFAVMIAVSILIFLFAPLFFNWKPQSSIYPWWFILATAMGFGGSVGRAIIGFLTDAKDMRKMRKDVREKQGDLKSSIEMYKKEIATLGRSVEA